MALNNEAYVTLCNYDPSPPVTTDPECFHVLIPVAALNAPSFDAQQLNEMFAAGFYLFALIFIVAMCKKMIET